MDINEIIKQGDYKKRGGHRASIFTINLKIPIFDKIVAVSAFNLDDLSLQSEKIKILEIIINKIIDFDISNLSWIKEEIWKHYNIYA